LLSLKRHGVSFVSMTQAFKTTNSMERLTLNILLSFAQFERELSAKRTRDKFAASRRKGLWMGGTPPLGYGVVVNESEVKLVRLIFSRFLRIGAAARLAQELRKARCTTKTEVRQVGKCRAGKPIDKAALYRILGNRVYLGEAHPVPASMPPSSIAPFGTRSTPSSARTP
jgi:DNA invertase Pin-like site-specific DNA recombinase